MLLALKSSKVHQYTFSYRKPQQEREYLYQNRKPQFSIDSGVCSTTHLTPSSLLPPASTNLSVRHLLFTTHINAFHTYAIPINYILHTKCIKRTHIICIYFHMLVNTCTTLNINNITCQNNEKTKNRKEKF